ncbi:MAG: ABC transporter ATP-binding protein/permease [Lachnospiraceae bacterium]|nr:ABC transporter ATP-binding protein/permease [Lachnospiraceae bacterium]
MKLKGLLTPEEIAQAIKKTSHYLEREGLAPGQLLRYRLSMEEALLFYQEKLGQDTPVFLNCRKCQGDLEVILKVSGDGYDPFGGDDPLQDRIMEKLDVLPVWESDARENRIRYSFPLYNTASKNYRFAWKYVSSQKNILFISIFLQLLSVVLGVVAPVLSARVIVGYMESEISKIVAIAVVLLVVRGLKNIFLVLSNRGYNKVYCRTLSLLENDLIQNTLRIKNSCLDEKGSGLFIQRLTNDTSRLATGFNRIADMITQMLNYIGILLAILVVSPIGFLLTFILLLIESMMEIYRTRRLCEDDRIYRTANEKFSGFVSETIRGARDVKLLNSEESFCREARERVQNANDKRLIMQGRSWSMKLARWQVGEVGTFLFIIMLALAIKYHFQEPAMVIVIYNYFSSLDVRAVTLAGEFMEFVKDFNLSVERVCALVINPEFPKERFGSETLSHPKGEIVFDNVTFAYPSGNPTVPAPKVLNNMSFTIKAGEMAALVGKSGCGKSTVFNLMCRLYDQQKGRILLDDTDIRDLDRDSIRDNMTVVSQSPYIFHLSVRENLQLAKEDMTEEEMKHVCKLACIDDDIEAMQNGYDTIIGEGGVNLSGGQRQRLAIARSLLKDYRVILFDEATSALDNVTQSKIQKAIDSISADRTVILIAHRLSTVINADHIMYMEDGRIIAEGTHEELLNSCESYRLLYKEEITGKNKESNG